MKRVTPLAWFVWILLGNLPVPAAPSPGLDPPALTDRLQQLQRQFPDLVRLQCAARTAAHREVWQVELGRGDETRRRQRPALLVVAGLEGDDLFGTRCVTAWMEDLAQRFNRDPHVRWTLETTTLYLFPCLNPDAAARAFQRPYTTSTVNARPVDDDHDGLADEDGPDDLDGDGLITGLRIQDPAGAYILDPADPRLLLKADPAKGEVGAWRWLSEGLDNDGDDAWNEDDLGGVNFNRNFPCQYQAFGPASGRHPVSEPETRALADFVIAHPNVGLIVTFGMPENLGQAPAPSAPPGTPPAGDDGPGTRGRRPATAPPAEDLPYYRELGRLYRDRLGVKGDLKNHAEPGSFSDWMYYHRGRLSLAVRPWSPALQLALTNAPPKEAPAQAASAPNHPKSNPPPARAGTASKSADDPRNEEERAFLRWIDAQAPAAFVPWHTFKHPEFPGRRVEIGGFAPFARTVPPADWIEPWLDKNRRFLSALTGKLPRIGIRLVRVKPLGHSVYDLTVEVENTGYLPTVMAHGVGTGEVLPTQVVLEVDEARLLAGTRRTFLGPIQGSGGLRAVRYVLHAPDQTKVQVRVLTALAGTAEQTILLQERP